MFFRSEILKSICYVRMLTVQVMFLTSAQERFFSFFKMNQKKYYHMVRENLVDRSLAKMNHLALWHSSKSPDFLSSAYDRLKQRSRRLSGERREKEVLLQREIFDLLYSAELDPDTQK